MGKQGELKGRNFSSEKLWMEITTRKPKIDLKKPQTRTKDGFQLSTANTWEERHIRVVAEGWRSAFSKVGGKKA